MIDELKLLKGDDIVISDKISVHHAKLSEIVDIGEDNYYTTVSTICATPSDYKAVLYDNFNIDWEDLGDFEFFMMMWSSLDTNVLLLILPNINPANFRYVQRKEDGTLGLYDELSDIFIDDKLYNEMVCYIRKIHGLTKHVDKSGNENTKKFLLKRARKEQNNKSNKSDKSMLAPLISSMVNCADFKYDHKSVWDLNIYQFMDAVKRIQKLKSVEHVMQGVYSGCVDQKKISKDALDWLGDIE